MESCNTVDLPPDCKEFDVICGRGGGSLRTSGNTAYREMIMMNRDVYGNLERKKRADISKSIVAFFRVQNPSGRFLDRHPETGDWYDIGDRKAIDKTSQALRESVRKVQQIKEPTPLNLEQEQAVAVLQKSHAEAYRQMSNSLPLDSVSSPLIEKFFRGMSSTDDENQRLESQESKKELSTTIKQNELPLECLTSEDIPSYSQEHNSHHECVSSKILQLQGKRSVLSCGNSSSKSNISIKHAKRRTSEGDSSEQEAPQFSNKRTRTATPPQSSNPNQGTTSEQISGEQSSARGATALAAISETGDVIAKLSSKIKELEQENYLLKLGFNTYQQKYETLRMKYENQNALIKLASSVAADNDALANGGGCASETWARSLLKKKKISQPNLLLRMASGSFQLGSNDTLASSQANWSGRSSNTGTHHNESWSNGLF